MESKAIAIIGPRSVECWQWNGYKLTVEISKPKNDSGKRRQKSTRSDKRRTGFSGNKRSERTSNKSSGGGKSFKSRFKENTSRGRKRS